ncbi:MAG: glycoside hydrolase family 13 protein [Bacteroidales bacterium]
MNLRLSLLSATLLFLNTFTFGQDSPEILNVEPPFWWSGMPEPTVQLMVYGKSISATLPEVNHPMVRLERVSRTSNPNYLFLDIRINPAMDADTIELEFLPRQGEPMIYRWPVYRRDTTRRPMGFGPQDVIYLLMPDRFANGNPANDDQPGLKEKSCRSCPDGRHGGDIQGIIDHIDYIRDLGITALWINPLVENDNPEYSYHGYAITNHYNIDARFGTNEDYRQLVRKCHDENIKVIMDMVFNHASVHHPMIMDLPDPDWIHQFDEFTRSNFRASTIFDIHALQADRDRMLTGWFDHHMADLNQKNPLLARYLIQNTIWWIEYAGIDGIRVDTQPYSDREFMAEWAETIREYYPGIGIVGEAWLQKPSLTAPFQSGSLNRDGYDSHIPSVTDFPLRNALQTAFTEPAGWTSGLASLYYIFTQDWLYGDPGQLLIFADNHDLDRFWTSIGEDIDTWKMAMGLLLTARGIPCIYYGTEILMDGREHDGHGQIRKDFPGGWPGDSLSLFDFSQGTELQKEARNFLKDLINWRNQNPAIHSGEMTQLIPDGTSYTYLRHTRNNCVLVSFNTSRSQVKVLDVSSFRNLIDQYTYAVDVLSGKPVYLMESFVVPPRSVLILDFKK